MNPEIWSKPYNRDFEDRELQGILVRYFEALASAKRIQIDPFEDCVKIRCTVQNCKERYKADLMAFKELSAPSGYHTLTKLAVEHEHFYQELGFTPQGRVSGGSLRSIQHKNSIMSRLFYCADCGEVSPFPWQRWDFHFCEHKNWGISLHKPNTMVWKSNAWVLMVDYDYNLWKYLNSAIADYDEVAVGWIVADQYADRVALACQHADYFGKRFKRTPKPKVFQGGPRGLVNSAKGNAALGVLSAIPPGYLPKVKKAIQSVLHPDRDPQNREVLTKAFQGFEEAWRKWEGK